MAEKTAEKMGEYGGYRERDCGNDGGVDGGEDGGE